MKPASGESRLSLDHGKINKKRMKLKAFRFLSVAALLTGGILVSCTADENSPGLEYMPDMYRSPAVEAYVDYGEVEGRYDEAAQTLVEEKFSYLPPVGTVPYGDHGEYMMPYEHGGPAGVDKTHGLFEVAQDTAGLANARLDKNPIPWSKEVVDEGKELFERFCIHCHGEKGAGDGTVITNSNDKYPPPPAYKSTMTGGEIVYIITYGKNAMGSHASQVSLEERWKLAHYVQKLAGAEPENAGEPGAVEGAEMAEGEEGAAGEEGVEEGEAGAVEGFQAVNEEEMNEHH